MPAPDPQPSVSRPPAEVPAPSESSEGALAADVWPPLPLAEWAETYATLHMMTQIVGKVRLRCEPMVNHWWQVPLYLSARGLTTSAMPHGTRSFEMEFDFIDHALVITVSDGGSREVALSSRPIARFYDDVMEATRELGVGVDIWPQPVEVENPIRFDEDNQHTVYVPEHAHRCWRVLLQAARSLGEFRSGFVGKCSPVQFFWGSFDLALTRFSGRRAPPHPGGIPHLADWVTREAYSHECSSCGFWPGSGAIPEPAFYAYFYPEPSGYRERSVRPAEAFFNEPMGEFILPYEAVRAAPDPDRLLHDFLQSTYEAGAELGGWNREELESGYAARSSAAGRPAPGFPRHDRGSSGGV